MSILNDQWFLSWWCPSMMNTEYAVVLTIRYFALRIQCDLADYFWHHYHPSNHHNNNNTNPLKEAYLT